MSKKRKETIPVNINLKMPRNSTIYQVEKYKYWPKQSNAEKECSFLSLIRWSIIQRCVGVAINHSPI